MNYSYFFSIQLFKFTKVSIKAMNEIFVENIECLFSSSIKVKVFKITCSMSDYEIRRKPERQYLSFLKKTGWNAELTSPESKILIKNGIHIETGMPDIVIQSDSRIIFVEVKSHIDAVRPSQLIYMTKNSHKYEFEIVFLRGK